MFMQCKYSISSVWCKSVTLLRSSGPSPGARRSQEWFQITLSSVIPRTRNPLINPCMCTQQEFSWVLAILSPQGTDLVLHLIPAPPGIPLLCAKEKKNIKVGHSSSHRFQIRLFLNGCLLKPISTILVSPCAWSPPCDSFPSLCELSPYCIAASSSPPHVWLLGTDSPLQWTKDSPHLKVQSPSSIICRVLPLSGEFVYI